MARSLSLSLSLFLSFSIWLPLSCAVPSGNLRHRPSYTLWLLPLVIPLCLFLSFLCPGRFSLPSLLPSLSLFLIVITPLFPLSLSLVSVSISIFSSFWWPLSRCVSLLQTLSLSLSLSLSLFLSLSLWVYLVSLPLSLWASILLPHLASLSLSSLCPFCFSSFLWPL